MFSIGDKVVYPPHGAGVIEAIESQEILGNCKQYYILKINHSSMKVMVPIDNCIRIGLRPIVGANKIDEVLCVLSEDPSKMPNNWNRRFKLNRDKIKTGDILEVAEVVRNLTLREQKKGLSTGEKRMLIRAKNILISELIFAKDESIDEINEQLSTIFSKNGGEKLEIVSETV